MRLGNLGGILYKDNVALIKFKFYKDSLQMLEILCTDKKYYPVEFFRWGISEYTIRKFFEERITPPTRQYIDEDLAKTRIQYYHPERIIRYSSGKCIHDHYWLECDNDESCWNE